MSIEQNDNPLLSGDELPDFSAVRAEHVEAAVTATLAAQRERFQQVAETAPEDFGWALELERIHEAVQRVWEPVVHLNAVCSSPDLREAYNQCLPSVTDFRLEIDRDARLCAGFERLRREGGFGDETQARLVELALRDFRLAGVALEGAARKRFGAISKRLAGLQARFEQNLMDATDAFRCHEPRREALAGLPEGLVERARKAAAAEGLEGYLLTLDAPTYTAVLAQAQSEDLRARFYEAWVTRASERGPQPERWDNAPLMDEILALRHESARLLGFESFAELSLESKMARAPGEVVEFLRDLAARSRPVARRELDELEAFAGRRLNAWDVAFHAERLKRERFELSAEELRPYFPLPRVLDGLFRVVRELFDVRVRPTEPPARWHTDVTAFELIEAGGRRIGLVLMDLYARPNKRGGAWMDGARTRARIPGLEQSPIAYLICNFNPPGEDTPSLLTHEEVVTLFHEFGHTLHHLLTEIDYPSIAGIHGVPWDAVELPSQFLENYAWLPETLPWISAHFETGESLPETKLATLKASRSFHAGLATVRQLEFALFDFRLHAEYDPLAGPGVNALLDAVRDEVGVVEVPAFNRFANTFAHIFAGGYAAGYYSYKWAEVLAADAFSAFEERGVLDPNSAGRFRQSILASGGSRDALAAFVEFRGRAPSLEPLLRQSGILA